MNLLRPLLLFVAACFAVSPVHAQWQWIDKDGRPVFSDVPPPSSVPDKNIIKRPRGGSASPAPVAPTPAAPAVAPAAGIDKSLEDKKKQAEAAEDAKRKEQEQRNAQIRAENCSRAQQAMAGLSAGGRMARTNERGEREYMDESAIAAEQQRVQTQINENCR